MPNNIIQICFDGTTNREEDNSTIRKLHKKGCQKFGESNSLYIRGPGSEGDGCCMLFKGVPGVLSENLSKFNIEWAVDQALAFVKEILKENKVERVIVNGFSRGCFSAILFSNKLLDEYSQLEVCAQLFDPTTSTHEAKKLYMAHKKRILLHDNLKYAVIYERSKEAEYDCCPYFFKLLQRVNIILDREPMFSEKAVSRVAANLSHLEMNGLRTNGCAGIFNACKKGYLSASVTNLPDNNLIYQNVEQLNEVVHSIFDIFSTHSIDEVSIKSNLVIESFKAHHDNIASLPAFDPRDSHLTAYLGDALTCCVGSVAHGLGQASDCMSAISDCTVSFFSRILTADEGLDDLPILTFPLDQPGLN